MAKNSGVWNCKVDTEKKAPVVVDLEENHRWIPPALKPDPEVARAGEALGETRSPPASINRSPSPNVPLAKPEIKRLIEEALRTETGSDFAWMNLGGVRDTLPQGQLLVRHIWDLMPFDNRVMVGTFKGRDLPAVVVGDRKVEPDRDYTLAVSDYTAENQGTSENLRTQGLKFPNDVGLMRDIIIDWFRKKKVIE